MFDVIVKENGKIVYSKFFDEIEILKDGAKLTIIELPSS
jgi:hypothetical protein